MTSLSQLPFLRITLPFAAGIALYDSLDYAQPGIWFFAIGAALLVLLGLFVLKIIPMPKYSLRWISGAPVIILLALCGYLRYSMYENLDGTTREWLKSNECKGDIKAIAVLEEAPQRKSKSYAAAALISGFSDESGVYRLGGFSIMAYFPHDSLVTDLGRGDTLMIFFRISPDLSQGNPEAFDYAKYLRRKGIHFTVWLGDDNWVLIGSGKQSLVNSITCDARSAITNRINHSRLDTVNKGLALALLIGIKDELDPEVNRSFSEAGAVHVLCVSGLHVGIIFLMVSTMLGYLQRIPRWGKPLFFFIGVVAIWGYALVTGMPPSVIRASVMFTFMLTGKLAIRKIPTMNSVFASAFILLLDEPPVLFHVGFQLSYLAVIGIITLHPVIASLWVPRKKVMIKIRDLLSVSMCAQLFTFPVAVKIFGIFPNYFLLTNLLILPITGFVIYAGVLFIALPFEVIFPFTEALFDSMLTIMRFLVDVVDALPGSVTGNIFISEPQTWLLLTCVFALMLWVNGEGRKFIHVALTALVIITGLSIYKTHERNSQQEVVFYQVKRAGVTDFISGRHLITIQTADTIPERDLSFATHGYRLKSGVVSGDKATSAVVVKDGTLTLVDHPAGKVIFINGLPYPSEKPLSCKVAVIGNSLKPCSEVFSSVDAGIWLADGSIPAWKAGKWQEMAETAGKAFWNTSVQGCFRLR